MARQRLAVLKRTWIKGQCSVGVMEGCAKVGVKGRAAAEPGWCMAQGCTPCLGNKSYNCTLLFGSRQKTSSRLLLPSLCALLMLQMCIFWVMFLNCLKLDNLFN